MTPQEKYFRQLLATLLPRGERVRQVGVVQRKTGDGGEVGLYFAAWTERRLLLVLTRRNAQTHRPKRLNLGVEQYDHASVRHVQKQVVQGSGRLLLQLETGAELEFWVDFSEPAVATQREFFEIPRAAATSGLEQDAGFADASSANASSAVLLAETVAGDEPVLLAGALSEEAPSATAKAEGAAPLRAALADEPVHIPGESLEAELARLEGLPVGAAVQPAPPFVPVASRMPPRGTAGVVAAPVAAVESYPLVRNEPLEPFPAATGQAAHGATAPAVAVAQPGLAPPTGPPPAIVPPNGPPPAASQPAISKPALAKPGPAPRRGGRGGGALALLLAFAGTTVILLMGCAGLFVVGLVATAGRSSSPPAFSSSSAGRSVRHVTVPRAPTSRSPAFQPPTFQPPSVTPPRFEPPTFEPPTPYRPPRGSSFGRPPSPLNSAEDTHREVMERMRQRQEDMSRRMRQQMEETRRRHERMMESMRRPFP